MIETICLNCGNRKSFEDNLIGKTFKCPRCSNSVIIQNVGSQINNEPQSMTNSFADEIARAEAEKIEAKRASEEAQRKALLTSQSKSTMLLVCLFFGTFGIHRQMMGYKQWWLMLLTFGGFGIWTLIDLIGIATGSLKMADGRDLR